MIDNIYNKIYPSSKLIFVEEIRKNLEFVLKDKIVRIFRAGFDLLIEIPGENLRLVVKELKENPELKINSFQSIATYEAEGKNFLVVNLNSTARDVSVILKIEMSYEKMEKNYIEIMDILKEFYKAAGFYQHRDEKIFDEADIKIHPGVLDGLDCFNLNIYTEDDIIKKAYVNVDISRIIDSKYYKDVRVYNLITYINKFDWKAGIFPEVCLCSAFEELLQLKVTERAQYIRMLLCELYRISNHIYFISNICSILQYDIAYNLSLLERERVLRIIEAITGSRIAPNFIRIGGVKEDISEEVLINVKKNLPILFRNIRRIEKIIVNDFMIIERLKNTGVICKEIALEYGITGPNLRASGIRYDLRKDGDLIFYRDLSFTVPVGRAGDCLDRVLIRFNEIYQSLRIINQIITKFPEGNYIRKINLLHLEFQPGVISYGIECPHGLFKIYMEVGERKINSLIVWGPSINSLILSEEILKGSKIEDIDLILMSLDISPGEIITT